jgi:leucyl-tRNA synthetase
MKSSYDHKKIEGKWQKYWEKKKLYNAKDPKKGKNQKKFFPLIEFPYPSGQGLHVGHIRSNTAMDIIARKRRMEGHNVLYPIGWDAFGLPTENFAIKNKLDPAIVTKRNTDTFRRQLKSLGFSFDWSREINTTDPKYYKWTQWIFLQFLKNGLAYKKKLSINWCPKDLIGLANEEVINGCCERCGTPVEKRDKEQWMLAITKYAERLDKDLDDTDFLPKIKTQQRNWIGKSEGAEINFHIKGTDKSIKVYTTRPDTIFGVSYIVIAPENSILIDIMSKVENVEDIKAYISQAKAKDEIERTNADKEKTGVCVKGISAINPANGETIPVWISDYVLGDYGTGAVMAVPAHDDRDYVFANKYNLPIKEVVIPHVIDKRNPPIPGKKTVTRRNVHAIVYNPKNGRILGLKWKKHPWTTFPMGGVEDKEDVISAARREVYEETGYKNLKDPRILGGQVMAEYYAAHKGENRISLTTAVLFTLENEDKDDVSVEESDAHETIWMNEKDVNEEKMTHAEMGIWLHRFTNKSQAYTGNGILINSKDFNGKNSEDVKKEITKYVKGNWVNKFKLRDWVFSRQRYWGEPIPVIHCRNCGIVPVPEKELPIKLPKVKNYLPTENGESPLAAITKWVNVKCPKCKGKAKRETDTMPNWAGSSWYYLRYTDPKNKKAFSDKEKLKYWTPVDWYNGGMEHTTLHLLYSRFWHKFLFDIGVVPTKEPYQKRTSHGLILAGGGEKMSKSKGNVVNPDDIVNNVGADTLRLYEMFMGPFDQAISWETDNIAGPRRFIERVWKLQDKINYTKTYKDSESTEIIINKVIKKVSDDIENMSFNTAVSSLMIAVNDLEKEKAISKKTFENLILILSPFIPHVTEELWSIIGNKASIHTQNWPNADISKTSSNKITIVVQVNGKIKASFETSKGMDDSYIENTALNMPEIKKIIEQNKVKKVIVVKDRLINIVV